MAPVRRYLRISKYSVLECRIYLDNPSLAQSWLLNPRNPVLPRIVESIRPLVLPKLREERERSKKKSSKKKSIKDVIVQDDFEVSMFLTETATRHSLLSKKKHFRDKGLPMMQSNSTKLIDETNHVPVDVDGEQEIAAILREEDSDDDGGNERLSEIPVARSKRRRDTTTSDHHTEESGGSDNAIDLDSDTERPVTKRARIPSALGEDASEGEEDDKKKLAMDVSYEGFAIYGRVLCLVVRRRENKTQRLRQDAEGQANMDNWITSTQIPVGEDGP
ncbi:hypothetical protein E4U17_002876 [Claviceps sp. LM77 group G4]|nr:hypothetical protein E4U17_002876 [Claviceps sp. LM77 group G4]KAG6081793.1 hypothetical protein E4U16_006994 [Claviceps sp. LM84 group G4]KAG6084723.1 hypothetical protein E4U33_002863 [Claviceps sp. LM78 group G4]